MFSRTLLERLEELCNIDVDDVDTELIRSLLIKPHNQTSNQAVIANALFESQNETLLADMVEKYGKEGWEKVFDNATVQMCARNVPYLSGHVLVQTSPRHINDRTAIIDQCYSFAKAFDEAGVPKDRFAIKLPFTGSAASAAVQLNTEGIRTLATAVFGLEQALAASQSKCLFISPYYNEIAAYEDVSLRINNPDPAMNHPMSARIIHMLEAFAKEYAETGTEQPVMVIASHFGIAEIMAMPELGCHHVTIRADNLRALMQTPCTLPTLSARHAKPKHPYAEIATPDRLRCLSKLDPLAGPNWDGILASSRKVDYVANGGEALDNAIHENPVMNKRFKDAMELFLNAEEKARVGIEKAIAKCWG
ncbi:aldolase [Rhizodiscina lignyota]|uniref:Aldolase n=1 Tax=Rhizodiscina lignyota TaxID=1504668 RepID=A0A9P4M9N1_9PEZI|nr:aldolase [Rhizodiscina lignyota]